MPRANWGISSSDVDDFDRDSQYMPYTGPEPENGVYVFLIKKLQFVAGVRNAKEDKKPQLRVGLELIPREDRDEDQYGGYFIMAFLPVAEKTAFRYVPFLDAIGVSGREFSERTLIDEEGNVKKIGQWRNSGEEYIMAQLKDGTDKDGASRKEVGMFLPYEDYDDEEEDYYDDEDPV